MPILPEIDTPLFNKRFKKFSNKVHLAKNVSIVVLGGLAFLLGIFLVMDLAMIHFTWSLSRNEPGVVISIVVSLIFFVLIFTGGCLLVTVVRKKILATQEIKKDSFQRAWKLLSDIHAYNNTVRAFEALASRETPEVDAVIESLLRLRISLAEAFVRRFLDGLGDRHE